MSDDQPCGLTILGRCGGGLRLVSDRVRSFEWESYPRREPRPARDRLRGLAPWRPELIGASALNGDGFAAMLERAIARSGQPQLLNEHAAPSKKLLSEDQKADLISFS